VRETDFAARLGGDEFCLLLPQTTPKEAVQTALRIRQRIAETVVTDGDYSRAVTVSMGIDAYDGRSKTSARDLRSRANQALKDAKKRGKNQVWLFTDRREVAGDAHATVEAEGEA
jgi:diguanylate cyclase (GGDEF)-like protein